MDITGGAKKKTILCDRYFYDEAIQARYLRISGGAFQGIYEALTVKPDVAFLLETESGEAYARKDEYDPEYFRAKSSLYDDYREKGLFVAVPSRQIPETRKIIEKYIDRVITGEFVK